MYLINDQKMKTKTIIKFNLINWQEHGILRTIITYKVIQSICLEKQFILKVEHCHFWCPAPRSTSTKMFMAAFFIKAKNEKLSKCLYTTKWAFKVSGIFGSKINQLQLNLNKP